jgi:hypothetical protein
MGDHRRKSDRRSNRRQLRLLDCDAAPGGGNRRGSHSHADVFVSLRASTVWCGGNHSGAGRQQDSCTRYAFVLFPIGVNSVALLAGALVYHRLTGHRYPHRAIHKTPAANHDATEIFTRADLDAVLRRRTEILDVDVDDLESVLEEVAQESQRRRVSMSNSS